MQRYRWWMALQAVQRMQLPLPPSLLSLAKDAS